VPEQIPILYDWPQHTITVALDGVVYEIRFTYRKRTASWYLDLVDPDGVALLLTRRLSPDFTPTGGLITAGPPGALLATGPDPYQRDEVQLWYLTAEEVAALPGETPTYQGITLAGTPIAPASLPDLDIPGLPIASGGSGSNLTPGSAR